MHIYYSTQHYHHATTDLIVDGVPFDTEEIPERAEIILHALQNAQLGIVHEPSDHGIEPLLAVHDSEFIDYLQNIYALSETHYQISAPVLPYTFANRQVRHNTRNLVGRAGYYCFGVGTPILEGTWTAAYWSAQCALSGADRLRTGDRVVYALCRPPGHHAATDLYGGLCYLNNAAIAARYLGEKTAILDIDYHHGNGTQEIFYTDPTVLYCSLHAHPDDDYPYYWGSSDERGAGAGEGFNYNWPLPQEVDDAHYLSVLDQALEIVGKFSPAYLIISLGLDIAKDDPLGGFCITTGGFTTIGERIAQMNLPTLIVQEGGYLLDALSQSILAFLQPFNMV